MPRKTASKKVPINIQRDTEQRLIDTKLRQATRGNRMSQIVAGAATLGLVAGVAVLVYFAFWREPARESPVDEKARITIPDGAAVSEPEPAPPPSPAEVAKQQVEILATPTGFLNVRSGPGTNNSKIGEAAPGDVFDLVSQDLERGWYEIRLTATTTGWVTKQYARARE